MFERTGAGAGEQVAGGPDAAHDQQGAGVEQVRLLLQQGVPVPATIADVIRANPADERAIFALLHGTLGNAYTQHVLSSVSAGAQAQPRPSHAAKNPAVADATKDDLNVVMKVLVYSGDRVVKRWQAKGRWEGPLPVTFHATHGKAGWEWDDVHGKDVRINTGRGGSGGQPIESWAGSGERIVVYAQPVGSVAVDLEAENDEKAPGLAKDKKDAGDGSTTDVKPGEGTKTGAEEKKKDGGATPNEKKDGGPKAKADEVGDGTDAAGHGAGEMAGEGEEDEGFADEAERELDDEIDGDVDDGKTTGKKTGGEKKDGRGEVGGDKDGKTSTDTIVGGEGPGGPGSKADGDKDGQRDVKTNDGTKDGDKDGKKWGSEEGKFGGEGGDKDRGVRGAMAIFGGLVSVPAALRGFVEMALLWAGGDLTGAGEAAFKKGVGKAASAVAVRRAIAKEARTIAAKETRQVMKELAKTPGWKALSKAEKGQLARITRWELQRKYFEGYLKAARQARREAKVALSRGSRASRAAAKERDAVAAMGEEAATVQPVAGRLPINHEFAGKAFPREALPPKYRSGGLRFKENGAPNFSPYAMELPAGGKAVKIELTGSMRADEKLANSAAGLPKTPNTHVWHHNEELGVMELIPKDLHSAVRHTGGQAGYKHVMGIEEYGK